MSLEAISSPPVSPAISARGRSVRLLLAAAALIIVGVVLQQTVLAARPLPVDVAIAARGSVEQTVTNTRAGTVKARLRASLSPENGGRVVVLPYREGARVARGALLLQLDDAMQRARLELAVEDVRAAEARTEEACVGAEWAQVELDRIVMLRERGIASEQLRDNLTSERDRAQAACRAASATLEQARAREQVARVDLSRTRLTAPFAGVLAEVGAEVGEWVSPSFPGMPIPAAIDILDPTSVYVTAPIDEMDAERVVVGQEVRLSVDSRRGAHLPGRLVRVAPYVLDVVEQNRTVEVEAELDDPGLAATLLPGTSADVEVILSRRDAVLQIPTSAIGADGRVLVVVGERLEERHVTTGMTNWRVTEVTDGLLDGDRVVTSRDSPDVKAGARVSVRGES